MRHISPEQMKQLAEEIPLKRIVFKRPENGFHFLIEMLAKSGEEITISQYGTPDPVLFNTETAMTFFGDAGFFSGIFDAVVLDLSYYMPKAFSFLGGRKEISIGELKQNRDRVEQSSMTAVEEDEFVREETAGPSPEKIGQIIHTYRTIQAQADESGLDPAKERQERVIGEQYLTTPNLVRLTAIFILIEYLMLLFFPHNKDIEQLVMTGTIMMAVLAISFAFLEKRTPNHPSLRIRRYIWLCVSLFIFSLTMSFFIVGMVVQPAVN